MGDILVGASKPRLEARLAMCASEEFDGALCAKLLSVRRCRVQHWYLRMLCCTALPALSTVYQCTETCHSRSLKQILPSPASNPATSLRIETTLSTISSPSPGPFFVSLPTNIRVAVSLVHSRCIFGTARLPIVRNHCIQPLTNLGNSGDFQSPSKKLRIVSSRPFSPRITQPRETRFACAFGFRFVCTAFSTYPALLRS